jgi:pentatricopeptide repeat protein
MKVYAYSGMYGKACVLYAQIRSDGLEPDQMMYGCLMKFSVECGRTALSQELSEQLSVLDIQHHGRWTKNDKHPLRGQVNVGPMTIL